MARGTASPLGNAASPPLRRGRAGLLAYVGTPAGLRHAKLPPYRRYQFRCPGRGS
jgi:hypothetical protein